MIQPLTGSRMVDSCPSSDEMLRWQAGSMPLDQAEELSRHLNICQSCRARLRGAAPAHEEQKPTSQDGQRDQTGVQAAGLSFLAPARAEGEIGWLAFFRVRSVLGEGGMGLVFLGEDTRLERPVALKVMKPDLARNEQAQKRFLAEVRAVASITNDHIVTIYHVGKEDEVPFFAMELLKGESLDRRLRREGSFAPGEAVRIARETAVGLAAAHEAGIVHRDIKPSNLWLEEGSQRVKILDFGLARPDNRAERLTETGHIMGTPDYMSPEQAGGRLIDARSDLFSLGSVLYEMCAGKTPFDRPSVTAVLTALVLEDPPKLSSFDPSFPPRLDALVQRLLAKDPNNRPATAREVVEELNAIEATPGLDARERLSVPPSADAGVTEVSARAFNLQPTNIEGQTPSQRTAELTGSGRSASRRKTRRKRKAARQHARRKKWPYVLAGLLAAAAGIFFFLIPPGPGEIVIDSTNPAIKLRLDDPRHGEIILDATIQQRFVVPPGIYFMILEGAQADDYHVVAPRDPLRVEPGRSITVVIRKHGEDGMPGWPPHPPPPGGFKNKKMKFEP